MVASRGAEPVRPATSETLNQREPRLVPVVGLEPKRHCCLTARASLPLGLSATGTTRCPSHCSRGFHPSAAWCGCRKQHLDHSRYPQLSRRILGLFWRCGWRRRSLKAAGQHLENFPWGNSLSPSGGVPSPGYSFARGQFFGHGRFMAAVSEPDLFPGWAGSGIFWAAAGLLLSAPLAEPLPTNGDASGTAGGQTTNSNIPLLPAES
jgi:hypothetical protein